MKIRAGDSVVVTTGKDKGKTGQILKVLPLKDRVVVAGINMRKRHMPKRANQAGQIITYEASIHSSNVMIIDPKTKKPSRIGTKIDDKGRRQRIAKKSGTVLTNSKPKAATTEVKNADSESKEKKGAAKKTAPKSKEKTTAETSASKPDAKPFWKRIGGFGSSETDEDSSE
jgi:large subunit ribosomal protein L24